MSFFFLFISHFLCSAQAGKIGIYYHLLDAHILDGNGIVVDGVIHNSPADKAGLERGDWILAVNGKSVFEDDLRKKIRIATSDSEHVELCVKKVQTSPVYQDQVEQSPSLAQGILFSHHDKTNVHTKPFVERRMHINYNAPKGFFILFCGARYKFSTEHIDVCPLENIYAHGTRYRRQPDLFIGSCEVLSQPFQLV